MCKYMEPLSLFTSEIEDSVINQLVSRGLIIDRVKKNTWTSEEEDRTKYMDYYIYLSDAADIDMTEINHIACEVSKEHKLCEEYHVFLKIR